MAADKMLYTLEEVAELLGVTRVHLGRIIRRGEIRVARLGHRTIRISDEALRDYIRAHEVTGPHYQEKEES